MKFAVQKTSSGGISRDQAFVENQLYTILVFCSTVDLELFILSSKSRKAVLIMEQKLLEAETQGVVCTTNVNHYPPTSASAFSEELDFSRLPAALAQMKETAAIPKPAIAPQQESSPHAAPRDSMDTHLDAGSTTEETAVPTLSAERFAGASRDCPQNDVPLTCAHSSHHIRSSSTNSSRAHGYR